MSTEKKNFWTRQKVTRSRSTGDIIDQETIPHWPNIIKFSVGIFILLILLIILWPFSIVGPTERAVIKTFGEVKEITLEPGLRFKIPLAQTITVYDLTPITANVNIPISSKDDSQAAITKDRQPIGAGGFYAWKYDENRILEIARNFSSNTRLRDQIDREIMSAIRQVIGRYDIAGIIPEQEKISREARDQAIRTLSDARIPIIITQLQLNNWDWSSGYNAMILQTVEMQQAEQRAAAELRKIEQETQQERIRAEATANALVASAEGRKRAAELDAQAAVLKAQGERDAAIAVAEGRNRANALIAQNMNVEIRLRELEIAKIEKERWDGRNIPTYIPLNPAGGVVTLPATPGR